MGAARSAPVRWAVTCPASRPAPQAAAARGSAGWSSRWPGPRRAAQLQATAAGGPLRLWCEARPALASRAPAIGPPAGEHGQAGGGCAGRDRRRRGPGERCTPARCLRRGGRAAGPRGQHLVAGRPQRRGGPPATLDASSELWRGSGVFFPHPAWRGGPMRRSFASVEASRGGDRAQLAAQARCRCGPR